MPVVITPLSPKHPNREDFCKDSFKVDTIDNPFNPSDVVVPREIRDTKQLGCLSVDVVLRKCNHLHLRYPYLCSQLKEQLRHDQQYSGRSPAATYKPYPGLLCSQCKAGGAVGGAIGGALGGAIGGAVAVRLRDPPLDWAGYDGPAKFEL